MVAIPAEDDREQQMLAAAHDLIVEGRTLNLSLGEVADRVGVSRSLLYVYFDGVPSMIDVLFRQHLTRLEQRVTALLDMRDGPDCATATQLYLAYQDYLIESGPILQLILRERHQDSPLGLESRQQFRRILRRIAGETCRMHDLAPREGFVLMELVAGIPEALARLVRDGEIDRDTAHATCRRLVSAAHEAFAIEPGR